LLELADRLWPGAEGWFAANDREFYIACEGTLKELISTTSSANLRLLDPDDQYSGRIVVELATRPIVLDWWHEAGGRKDAKDLKVWAGTMESHGIARAMQKVMREASFQSSTLLRSAWLLMTLKNRTRKKNHITLTHVVDRIPMHAMWDFPPTIWG
jgi:CRISPR-associated protein Csx14